MLLARACTRLPEIECLPFVPLRFTNQALMANPHFRRFEVVLKNGGHGNGSGTSGNRGRQLPGGSGAPQGYNGSWMTGWSRSPIGPIGGNTDDESSPATVEPTMNPITTVATASPAPAAPPADAAPIDDTPASTPPISTPTASTPSARASTPQGYIVAQGRWVNPILVGVNAEEHRRKNTPPQRRSRSPPPC